MNSLRTFFVICSTAIRPSFSKFNAKLRKKSVTKDGFWKINAE